MRARVMQGVGDARIFRVATLDPDGINMPPVFQVVEDNPENTCFEYDITAAQLDSLPTKADGIRGPVRLEPVADQWHDDDGEGTIG